MLIRQEKVDFQESGGFDADKKTLKKIAESYPDSFKRKVYILCLYTGPVRVGRGPVESYVAPGMRHAFLPAAAIGRARACGDGGRGLPGECIW